MKHNRILPILIYFQLFITVVLFVFVIRLQIDINIALHRIDLSRVVAAGRTRQDVIQRLGKPDYYEKHVFSHEKALYSLMTYRGGVFNRSRLNGNETINIILNEDDQIVTTYFESPSDQVSFERRISSK